MDQGHQQRTPGRLKEALHAGASGATAAMAMSGMRSFTVALGLVDETPPVAIARQKARGMLKFVPKRWRHAGVELAHWGFGAAGGAVFGMLPDSVRRRAWTGPVYGVLVWLGFEAGIAPVVGLSQAGRLRLEDRLALAGDHLLYGLVLSETRRRPGE